MHSFYYLFSVIIFKVIVALLKKFKVADNPRKFALFECYQEEDNHSKLPFYHIPFFFNFLRGTVAYF